MEEKFLPIGTIVLLKGAKKKVMINGYLCSDQKNKMSDYLGCPFPEGLVSPDLNLLFDHEQIEQIITLGYKDEDYQKLNNSLKNIIEQIKK